jgi:hypothetical protein
MNDEHSHMASSSISHQALMVGEAYRMAASEHQEVAMQLKRPFMLLKPKIMRVGNQWCALYGDDLQVGVAGFGDTPEKAAQDFDKNWLNARA